MKLQRHRRKKPNLGRAVLTPRQALTSALIASNNGDCKQAWSHYQEAEAADGVEKRLIGKDRYDDVRSAVSICKPARDPYLSGVTFDGEKVIFGLLAGLGALVVFAVLKPRD